MDLRTFAARLRQAASDLHVAGQERLARLLHEEIKDAFQANVQTAGKASNQMWDFSGEPLYGASVSHTPLFPLLFKSQLWTLSSAGRTSHEVFGIDMDALTQTGGVGPFGERFPARDAYRLPPNSEARREFAREAADTIRTSLGGA